MKILVTGGAGFIGSHVVDAYVAAGHEVLIVDSLWSRGGGRPKNINPAAQFYQLDIRSPEAAELIIRERPEVVNLHAAQHSVGVSTEDPRLDAEVNVIGLINLLGACTQAGTRKVICAGSAAVFGSTEQLPVTELSPQRPESPYGITKMTIAHYLRYYQQAGGPAYTLFHYGNVYGPRQDPSGEAGVIAIFIAQILAGKPVRIDWDGEQQRDYVYVGDIARANVQALTRGENEVFCIATGQGVSVNQLYRHLCDLIGRESPVTHAPKRSGDIYKSYFDCTKAAQLLEWKAEMAFKDGLAQTIQGLRG